MRRYLGEAVVAGVALVMAGSAAAATTGKAAEGAKLFQQRCVSCHTVKGNAGIGPDLRGVVGRKAGAGSFARYTPALKKTNLTFDVAELDRFLAAPQRVAPGSAMMISTPRQEDRAHLIAFLATLKK
ncbi:MAG: hypothetical protein A2790_13510 [Phenylobacterium sp. RIFCSPHIGHO2_01_FULL_69_31]|uniref:c-type cytochrome n=1 Tax=unclassified Phenylobacterium TaxID=2640670 RepID=UPI0008AE21B5|nr:MULTISPECIES: c-type cytochrome [unclassified Phenylobacterium]OHB26874.1 MAG: hypothetical protein A2790_13510 [Phenylobacterium sp. RIFCSPHIGHO2_01_FULL_69_31]TAJ69377.1 MAG: c-type cytochrome [Phenylobacterium sp.]